jgi:hypothetical protein
MVGKFNYCKIDSVPATIVKIRKKDIREEKVANASSEIDYASSNIIRKTLEMTRTLQKYPRPRRNE